MTGVCREIFRAIHEGKWLSKEHYSDDIVKERDRMWMQNGIPGESTFHQEQNKRNLMR